MSRRTSIAVKFCWELGPSLANFPFPSLVVTPPRPEPLDGGFLRMLGKDAQALTRRDDCPSTLHGHLYHPPPHLCNPSPMEPQGE